MESLFNLNRGFIVEASMLAVAHTMLVIVAIVVSIVAGNITYHSWIWQFFKQYLWVFE